MHGSESAATATALLCGVKAQQGTVGVNDKVRVDNCSQVEENAVKSIFKHAMDDGLCLLIYYFRSSHLQTLFG